MKLLEKKSTETLQDIGKGNHSLDNPRKAQETKAKETNGITSSRKALPASAEMLTAQEKIFSMHSSDQKSILKVDEEFKIVLIKISNTIKLANDLNRPFLKRKKKNI